MECCKLLDFTLRQRSKKPLSLRDPEVCFRLLRTCGSLWYNVVLTFKIFFVYFICYVRMALTFQLSLCGYFNLHFDTADSAHNFAAQHRPQFHSKHVQSTFFYRKAAQPYVLKARSCKNGNYFVDQKGSRGQYTLALLPSGVIKTWTCSDNLQGQRYSRTSLRTFLPGCFENKLNKVKLK